MPQFPLSRIDQQRPGIVVDGVWLPPMAYVSYLPRTEYYRQMADCGIHLYCFPAYLAGRGINTLSGIGPFRKGIWVGNDRYDFADIEEDMEKILAADQAAHVLVRLHLDVPEWWERQYPQACCLQRDGRLLRQSFSSPVWQRVAGQALRATIAWLKISAYAPHVIGIHIAAGMTEEWMYHSCEDKNPSRVAAFSAYLNERYAGLPARQAAWADSTLQAENEILAVPGQAPEMRWRDPGRDAAALDALHFHSHLLADTIRLFCRIVKEESQSRLLTGAFYGYHFYVPDARAGHTALSRLLDCADLDYLASPNMYDRSPGIDWPPMVAVDSVRLHGKLWMAENDTRTSLTRPLAATAPEICPAGQYQGGVWEGPAELETSRWLLRANAARMLTHGYGGWWFDMWGGWFAHPDLLSELKAIQELWSTDSSGCDAKVVPPNTLCVVVDERLAEYDASFGQLCQTLLENRRALGCCGRPYVIYLRDDLPRLDLTHAAFVWMLGIPELTAGERIVLQQCASTGSVVLHTSLEASRLYAPPPALAGEPACGVTLPGQHLRALLDRANIHCYLDTEDVFYIGRGYLAIHAAESGEKYIRLPFPASVGQLLPEKTPAHLTDTVRITMQRYETRLFEMTGKIHSI